MPRTPNLIEYTNTSLRLETDLFKRGEKYWRKHQMKNRSELYITALESYMNESICPFCGARNPKGGRVCSVCLRPLSIDDEVHLTIQLINTKKEEIEEI